MRNYLKLFDPGAKRSVPSVDGIRRSRPAQFFFFDDSSPRETDTAVAKARLLAKKYDCLSTFLPLFKYTEIPTVGEWPEGWIDDEKDARTLRGDD